MRLGGAVGRAFAWIAERSRRRRMALLYRMLPVHGATRVLDVGGTLSIWRYAPVMPRLVLLNQPRAAADVEPDVPTVFGDATALPFRDAAFDLVFSNSVVEHVGEAAAQARFAAELVRVGRAYWVQTPNARFPIEQHLWTPLVHWLPRSWQRHWLRRRTTVWEWVTRPSADRRQYYVEHYLNSVRLLTAHRMRSLFPGASIIKERIGPFCKALIAFCESSGTGVGVSEPPRPQTCGADGEP